MTGREMIKQAFHCEPLERAPWVPFVGCHAASLIGKTASEYLRDGDLILAGVKEAVRRYTPDGIPVLFDLQLEAEVLGCRLVWADQNPPSVVSHPLQEGKALKDLRVPTSADGRIGLVLSATRKIRAAFPDLALYGLITGPFTLALHLLGTNIFMDMFDKPGEVKALMEFCGAVCRAMADCYREAGCDVVAVVDPMTSQIGPEQFREFVTPFAAPVFSHIRRAGVLSSFFVCGHAQQNVEAMCECGPHNVSVDENIPLEFVRDVCLPRGISFGGNLQLTTVLLLGTQNASQRNALQCLDIGGGKGFVLAPGCDLPYAVPPENLEAVTRVALDPYQRDVARTLGKEKVEEDLLDLAEYGQSDRIIIDIITLDSEACAPCQYMVESVKAITPEFEGIVEWREHKIKQKESLVFMTSLMVKNIPTICIDGKITFVSRIPAKEELIAAIHQRIREKLRFRIAKRKTSLIVLGDGGDACRRLKENAERARYELGADVEITMETDPDEVLAYGVAPVQTPAVVMAHYQVKSLRKVPEVNIIKEWMKESL